MVDYSAFFALPGYLIVLVIVLMMSMVAFAVLRFTDDRTA